MTEPLSRGIILAYVVQVFCLLVAILGLFTDGIAQIITPIFSVIFIVFVIAILFFMFAEEQSRIYSLLFSVLSGLQIVILLWFIKPMVHGIAYDLYLNPWILEALAISFAIGIIVFFIRKLTYRRNRWNSDNAIAYGFVVFLISISILVVWFFLVSSFPQCYIAEHLDIEETYELPHMDPDFVRVTPMKVANRYANDACQYPRHTPNTPSDITMINGTPHWSYLLVPDGIINVYNIKPQGAIFIDMTTMDKELDVIEYAFEVSPGLALTDDIYWKLHEYHYWADCERTMVVPYENEIYLAVSYIEYELQFSFPIFYRTPVWGGVFLVDKEGNIEDLSPEEAQQNPILAEQKIFPEKLVLTYIDSQKYWKAKDGDYMGAIFNVWFYHEDELEITNVAGQGNSQPFLLNTDEGFKWIVSVEPYGQAHGIYRIYLLDARNGTIEMIKYNTDEIGPVKATNYARTANPIVDWSRFKVIEPIPVTPNGELYWEVRVVPSEGSGISYTAFVNPKTGKVIECKTDSQIQQFMEGHITFEDVKDEIIGEVEDIDTYIQNGNTRWIIAINGTDYIAKAEELTSSSLSVLVDIQVNDNIKLIFNDDNSVKTVEVIDE